MVPARKLRIAQVITGLVLGGGGQVMLTIARNLDRTQFEMDIYCVIGGGELLPEIEAMGYPIRVIPSYVGERTFRYRPRQVWQLARELRQGRYDLVHTHLFQADVIGRTAALAAGVPRIVKSLHNMGAWKKWHHLLVDGCLSSRTDRVICCSEALRESAIRQEKLDPGRVVTIYHGVDQARFRPAVDRVSYCRELGLDPARRVVGTIGRPIPEKGHEHLLDALPAILRRHPDAQFLIVGEGPLRGAHIARMEREGLSHAIRFVGARPDIPELLSLMDVFVFPSVREGLGIAVLEAMASGVPLIASDIRPLSEMVTHERTGLLVEAASPPALAAAVNRLLSDDGLRQTLRSNALAHVKAHFTERQMVQSIESVYLELCDRSTTPSGLEQHSRCLA
jgi:glycosyltransferase involved in cell wall biosynthesis